MIKPSFAVAVEDGKPVILKCSLNADEVLSAYKKHEGEAYVFIRPASTKSKTAKAGPAPDPAKPVKAKGK